MMLANFDPAAFLRDHWQKMPLLIRQGWADWCNPLAPDDLAGLACEDNVESRLITQARQGWHVEPGPIPETRFGKLGKAPWTLLVQAVDHHVPEVAALLGAFRFIPDWRIDDVMVSYATDGGGVGPHFDQYDVFLIQGLGQRRWQVGGLCDADTALLPHDELRLLADFKATEEWLLGDDCITYSIGFRAPSRSELIAHYCDHLLAELADDDRYADPDLDLQQCPGEIAPAALAKLHGMITEKLADRDAFARWFGRYNSAPKYPEVDWSPADSFGVEEVERRLSSGTALMPNPASRFSFCRATNGAPLLFVDGESFALTQQDGPFVELLCGREASTPTAAMLAGVGSIELLRQLINRGSLAFADDD
jgi:50S ribosomal protein L16 3-hydroxylase